MFILVETEGETLPYNFHVALNIVEDSYNIDKHIYVWFEKDVRKPDGTKVRGGYGTAFAMTKSGPAPMHVITIDDSCDFEEAATVLLHEYAHVLSQQNHDFTMYELWREWLREEFQRRWYNAIGKEDWEADRGRTFVVGEVCRNGEDEHLQE